MTAAERARMQRLVAVAKAANNLLMHNGPCDDIDDDDVPYESVCGAFDCPYCMLVKAANAEEFHDCDNVPEEPVQEILSAPDDYEAMRRHYDAAGPEHNLLALLDLYEARATEASVHVDEIHLVMEELQKECRAKALEIQRLKDQLDLQLAIRRMG